MSNQIIRGSILTDPNAAPLSVKVDPTGNAVQIVDGFGGVYTAGVVQGIAQPAPNAAALVVIERPSGFTTALDFDASNNPIYIGLSTQGAAKSSADWQIRRITFDGNNNPTDIQWANGSPNFSAIWDDRASLSYH